MAYDETTDYLQGFASDALQEAENQSRRIAGRGRPNLKESEYGVQPSAPSQGDKTSLSDWLGDPDNYEQDEFDRLSNMTEEWLNSYFPELTGNLQGVPEEWLVNILSGVNPYGDASDAMENVWEQARDRAESSAKDAQDAVSAEFSNNGFSLPPGAYVAATIDIHRRAARETNEVATQVAMKDAELRVQVQTQAAQIAAQLKTGIMDSLSRFYQSWVRLPDSVAERQRVRVQAMAGLQESINAYHRVELSFQELRMRAEGDRVGQNHNVDTNRIRSMDLGQANQALGQAVRGFADIASSAANASGSLTAEITSI